jgi:DNA replication protein DnaC
MSAAIDATRLSFILNELRLPAIKHVWPKFAERSDKEGWTAARFLGAIAEHELAERDRRRVERHLTEAKLLPGKTLENFDFEATPMISKAQVSALCAGDGWLEGGANLLLFGPPGGGKSHLASAIGLALVASGWRVHFARTSDLVQKLQVARRELALESAIGGLERFDLLILDDITYVTKDQAETSVLFELISARYGEPAGRGMGQDLPRPGHDPRGRGSPRSPCNDLRDERRELSSPHRRRAQARAPRTPRHPEERRGPRAARQST